MSSSLVDLLNGISGHLHPNPVSSSLLHCFTDTSVATYRDPSLQTLYPSLRSRPPTDLITFVDHSIGALLRSLFSPSSTTPLLTFVNHPSLPSSTHSPLHSLRIVHHPPSLLTFVQHHPAHSLPSRPPPSPLPSLLQPSPSSLPLHRQPRPFASSPSCRHAGATQR